MTRCLTPALALFLLTTWPARTQSAGKPAFEVASVKPSPGGSLSTQPRRDGNRVVWNNTVPIFLLQYAFELHYQRIVSKLPLTLYSIEAVVSGSPSDKDLRLMFQDLLEQRFGLKHHREIRELSVYTLVPAPGGVRLRPTREGVDVKMGGKPLPAGLAGNFSERDGAHLAGRAVTMEQFVEALGSPLDGLVVNETGISDGLFDFDVLYGRDTATLETSGLASIRTAIDEQLGLRVRSEKRSVEVLVIDAFGSPTPN